MIDAYLSRLGLPRERPSVDYLYALHRAHVSRVVYTNLGILQGRPASIDPLHSAREIIDGRGGYCFHLNGAFSWLLRELGFAVTLHRGYVARRDETDEPNLISNHLVLLVHDLPGVFVADAGLGDALYEPLPLIAGDYKQGPFSYQLAAATYRDGWRLTHDPHGSFAAMEFESAGTVISEFETAHEFLSTSPDSSFTRFITAQVRHADRVEVIRGCLLTLVDATGKRSIPLDTEADWCDTLARLGLARDGVAELWPSERATHEQWMATA